MPQQNADILSDRMFVASLPATREEQKSFMNWLSSQLFPLVLSKVCWAFIGKLDSKCLLFYFIKKQSNIQSACQNLNQKGEF